MSHAITEILFESNGVELVGQLHRNTPEGSTDAVVIILTGDSPKGTTSKTWDPMVEILLDIGLVVFAFDFHSQGRSSGDRQDLNLTLGKQNFLDAYSELGNQLDLTHAKIGLLGSSFGGAVVLAAYNSIPHCDSIAFKSPASFLAESYETEHGFPHGMSEWKSKEISPITGIHYSAYLDALHYNLYTPCLAISCPVLVVHGIDDTIVPIGQSRRLHHLIGEGCTLLELPGVMHDYKQPGAPEELQAAVRSHFLTTLVESPASKGRRP
jgi:pimeloyl-ACP methyl ester carboxylesterase